MQALPLLLLTLLCLLLPRAAAQLHIGILAVGRDGYVVFDVRNAGDKPAAFVPLATDTLHNYGLRYGDTPDTLHHPAMLYCCTFLPTVTPPLLLQPGECRRYADTFSEFPDYLFRRSRELRMAYRFGLDDYNTLLLEAKRPFHHTASQVAFWKKRWPQVKDCLVEAMDSPPVELPEALLLVPSQQSDAREAPLSIRDVGRLPGDSGALRLRLGGAEQGAAYTLLVVDAEGREHRWAARAEGSPQASAEGEGELDVLPPSPEALAALSRPVMMRLVCGEGEARREGCPLYVLPACFERHGRLEEEAASELQSDSGAYEPLIPKQGAAAEPELKLVSIEEQGQALLAVENHGTHPLCIPCSGCAEAAPAYRLHLWDAEGRETQVDALVDAAMAGRLRQLCHHLVPPGGTELVEVDFAPLPQEALRTARRVTVSFDAARCGLGEETLRLGENALLPPLHSLARPMNEGARRGLGRNGRVLGCRLRLLSLDLETGEAHCELGDEWSSSDTRYFTPGTPWGDSCFSLRVRDAEGREYGWDIPPRRYPHNGALVEALPSGESRREHIPFAFLPEEGKELTEEQRAFLAALRREGSQVRAEYHMTQACFLSSAFADGALPLQSFQEGRSGREAAFAESRDTSVRVMESRWEPVEAVAR